MDLLEVQTTIKELEKERYYIQDFLTRALRIAQYRKDLKDIIFFRLNKINLNEENVDEVYKELKGLALRQGLPLEQYGELFYKIHKKVGELRKGNWYDPKTKKVNKDRLTPLPVSELTSNLDHFNELIVTNKIPEGLGTLDTYAAMEKKETLDTVYFNQVANHKNILNKIRDYIFDYFIYVENQIINTREREVLSTQGELEQLIADGYEARDKCYHSDRTVMGGGYISGAEYVTWIQKCKLFIKKSINDSDFYNSFSEIATHANGFSVNVFVELIGMLKALDSYDFSEIHTKGDEHGRKIDKIFISHASKDIKYVDALVELLNDIGIAKDSQSIFCSSLPGYDIPHGESIYDFLKKELNNSNIMVLFVLSHNYYQSAPCLNEMGAAWITSKRNSTVLTPNFDFKHIMGAIDPSQISFKMNDKDGLDKFKDDIVKTLELTDVDYKFWQKDRDKFLSNIAPISAEEASTLNVNITLEKIKKKDENQLELQLRFKNVTEKDIEIQYLDFELVDQNGNVLKLSTEDKLLDDFILYSNENKVEKWSFLYDESSNGYNPRRNDKDKVKIDFSL